ncbi:flagellar protein FlgN [Chitinimonas sp.]|uniref:flagella synthesis protein FlgN n=1 Tax=Chitinimonas sp. TaxID=1934313 RepID=UPI002F9399EA
MSSPLLLTTLENELAHIQTFIETLEQEQQALIDNTLAELETLSKQKTAHAATLEQLARERKRLFDVNGVELSPHPPHQLVSARHLPAEQLPALQQAWDRLIQAARQASALNNTNGQLIQTRQQQNQQLMSLLQNSQNANLSYDALGQPRLSRSSGSLGKA